MFIVCRYFGIHKTSRIIPQPMKTASKYRNSRGFSMIEILVAIGILVVLIGIVAFTVSNVTTGAKKNETKVRMEALNAMFTELQTTAKLNKQPGRMFYGTTPTAWDASTDGPLDIWKDGDPSVPAIGVTTNLYQPVGPVGLVTEDAFNTGKHDRIKSAAVHNTQLVLGLLLSVPRNQSTLANLPPKSFMDNPYKNTTPVAANLGSITFVNASDKKTAFKPALLVDGWNNPIIFVPAAGLRGVKFKEHGDELHVITSTNKLIEEGATFDPLGYVTPGGAIPFFASAGPDGDFSTGDDNVYSFEN